MQQPKHTDEGRQERGRGPRPPEGAPQEQTAREGEPVEEE